AEAAAHRSVRLEGRARERPLLLRRRGSERDGDHQRAPAHRGHLALRHGARSGRPSRCDGGHEPRALHPLHPHHEGPAARPPPRVRVAETAEGRYRAPLYEPTGWAVCHAPTLTAAPAGTPLFGGPYRVPQALGGRTLHPYSDYLLHDVGTGDGIELAVPEHHGPEFDGLQQSFAANANKLRTAPLWGLRTRSRLMHDGLSATLREAIGRPQGEAPFARSAF